MIKATMNFWINNPNFSEIDIFLIIDIFTYGHKLSYTIKFSFLCASLQQSC